MIFLCWKMHRYIRSNSQCYTTTKCNANIDEVICGGTHSLNAIPSVGTGTWTSSSNLTISDINNPTSLVSVSDYEQHSFTWTETNFSADSDEVEIIYSSPASFAGDSMIICPGDDLQNLTVPSQIIQIFIG